jgi:hypothetical protein
MRHEKIGRRPKMLGPAKYKLRFWIKWGSDSCLDDVTRNALGGGVSYIDLQDLPFSVGTAARITELCAWYQESLNWDYPPDPGPWRQAECDRFNAAVLALLPIVTAELGEDFEVINAQKLATEDPDLDAYLKDPKSFRRHPP